MRLVLATPLYPPDVAEPAPYVKELAKRLANNPKNKITIVTFGYLPEKVPGVEIVSVDSQRPLMLRLLSYTRALARAIKNADLVFAENGASVELSLVLASLFSKVPVIVHRGDISAHEHASRNPIYRTIEALAHARASEQMIDVPLSRPKILPFAPYPADALQKYEHSWTTHLELLRTAFAKYAHD